MAAYEFPLLIKQLLLTPRSANTPKAIVYGERRFSYSEFAERVNRLGSALRGLGVRPGDTVAVMDWDSNRYLECYFAIPMLGAILQTVNVRLSPEQITYCLNHAEASLLICNTDFAPLYETLAPHLASVKQVAWMSDTGSVPDGTTTAGAYEALLAAGDPAHVFADFDENTPATLFYTTGTTGLPKGVSFTHRQLVLHTLATLGTFRLTQSDVYMPITPMFHVHAWGVPFVATLVGCTQIYPGRYLPDVLLRLLRDEKVTFSHCVPTILQMILDAPLAAEADLRGLRMVIGGPCRAPCVRRRWPAESIFSGAMGCLKPVRSSASLKSIPTQRPGTTTK